MYPAGAWAGTETDNASCSISVGFAGPLDWNPLPLESFGVVSRMSFFWLSFMYRISTNNKVWPSARMRSKVESPTRARIYIDGERSRILVYQTGTVRKEPYLLQIQRFLYIGPVQTKICRITILRINHTMNW